MYQTRSLVGSAENQDVLAIGDARMILRTYERYNAFGEKAFMDKALEAMDTFLRD